MCDVPNCDRPGEILVEGGFLICHTHNRIPTFVVCIHCGIEMVSQTNHAPKTDRLHDKTCPRHDLWPK